jgi:hypothetical protein
MKWGRSSTFIRTKSHEMEWLPQRGHAPPDLDESVIDVGAIPQEHVSKGAPVLVEAVRLERDFFC